MPPAAGQRDRFVWYSLHEHVRAGLDLLGWFDDPVANDLDRQAVHMPFGGYTEGVTIPVNSIVLMPGDTGYSGLEIGSNSQRGDRVYLVDIYAEDHATGVHLRGDISALLRGQLPDLGYDNNVLEVIDPDQATPSVFAVLDIENVREDRAYGGNDPWEQYWYSIMLVIEDDVWTDG
jgi:hypothetical protein